MKKNRKRSNKMSVTASRSMHFAAVIMMLFVMVIVNMLAGSRCDQMLKTIGEKENLLAKLEKDRERECGRWEQINTDERLDNILLRLGMSMKYAHPKQIVRMDANGRPYPGQLSVAYDQRRRRQKPESGNAQTMPSRRRR